VTFQRISLGQVALTASVGKDERIDPPLRVRIYNPGMDQPNFGAPFTELSWSGDFTLDLGGYISSRDEATRVSPVTVSV
jgi:hypothetical protein